jgi:MFS family permease
VGWLFIAVSIPQVALSLLFGRLVDKVDRRTLCVLSDLVSAATACALPI